MFRKLRKEAGADAVADLHDVLRTKVLRSFFRWSGTPVYRIDKGRREKRELVKGTLFRPLKHSVERYLEVFRQAGLRTLPAGPEPHIHVPEAWKNDLPVPVPEGLKVGIAPCARHILKTWPHDRMIRLMRMIRVHRKKVTFYLFGGTEDREVLERIAENVGGNVYLTLPMSLRKQLALMQQMHWVISMDSANMHLAALLGVPVISIWGATHPYAGFAPWGADEKWQIQIPKEELPCRPCTVYGKGRCHRGDMACLNRITPERIMAAMV
ncbi:MAG: glycosyltransferase family 9 protein [Bacteroidales bacterium]|nr:glycosyltransferase family 9 protein [Bacteroidales bacterium]